MLELFLEYRNSREIKKALLVGQSLVNQNPGNKEIFEVYFDFLISLVDSQEINSAKSLMNQAVGVLAFFSDNVKMERETVEYILTKEKDLDTATQSLSKREEEIRKETVRKEVVYNNDAFSLLERLMERISNCENETDFHSYLDDLGKIDQSINREQLSSSQESKYAALTDKCSRIVGNKMSYFETIKNRTYNIEAIEAYEKVFNMFKNGKIIDTHKSALKSMFTFDTSRLYNETLVYYNHVYNYILGKLNDDDKFLMTKYAIMCEKAR